MLKKIVFLLFVFCAIAHQAVAEELHFKKLSVKQLKQVYDIYNYHGEKDFLMVPSYKYPAIFLSHFPDDFNTITDEKERNALFIKILAPMAIKINQKYLADRDILLPIKETFEKKQKITSKQSEQLEKFAKEYDAFTRLKGDERIVFLLRELDLKINKIPASLLITAAAIETNWGASRIVKEGNSLYKTVVWHTKEGLKPIGETEDDSYRIKIYPDIYSSMKEFAHTINSDLKYRDMRDIRREFLIRKNPALGTILAPYIIWKSPLQNYAGLFQYTLAYYELNIIDKSSLDSTISADKLTKELNKLRL